MNWNDKTGLLAALVAVGLLGGAVGPAAAATRIEGQVQAGGGPVAGSTVTLWAASANSPAQLAQVTTGADGSFVVSADQTPDGSILYLVATNGTPSASKQSGNNPAIALLAVLGGNPPAHVVINEMTTVASVWTHAQFLDGTAIKGHALGLRIAAGNVPNFVDLSTGGWGEAIQGPLNGGQTPTMANFATLADVLAGCATRVTDDACAKLFAAATPPKGKRADRHADGGGVDRTLSVVPARAAVRPARPVLSGPTGQDGRPAEAAKHARGSVHAVPELGAQRLGPAAQIRRRRISRGRQGHVRQRGQPLGRRQLHGRLAGAGRAVARQRHQVRPQRQAAVAHHDRLYRRRDGGRHLRRGRRRPGQRLVHHLRRPFDRGVRQERQAADAAGAASRSTAGSG